MVRTEEEKIIQAPLSVVLGGEEYEIKPLVIRDSRRWRKLVAEKLAELTKLAELDTKDGTAFVNAMTAMLGDEAIDLFFAYAQELNREEIEAVANDAEIALAFKQVYEIAFPLKASLTGAMGAMNGANAPAR
ncbi:MAG: hypothetical protein P3T54_00210 [Dehalogenimonas sp.]|nr:hypothetical protein [Dehalogenimonas sp.]